VSPLLPHRPHARLRAGIATLALAVAALTACGDGDATASGDATSPPSESATTESSASASASSASGAPAEAEAITATEADFSISLDEDSLAPGTYEIQVVNQGNASHDLFVEQDGNDIAGTGTIAPGSSETFTVDLQPGEYVFYCSIGNHRAMGMEQTVTVE
jgi:plastocyanin